LRGIYENTNAMVKALRKVTRLQHGGFVTMPTLAVVGEAGPEAVIPLRNAENMGLGSRTENQIVFAPQISAVDAEGVSELIHNQIFPEFVNIIRNNRGAGRTDMREALGVKT
jgi:hypothetical protein